MSGFLHSGSAQGEPPASREPAHAQASGRARAGVDLCHAGPNFPLRGGPSGCADGRHTPGALSREIIGEAIKRLAQHDAEAAARIGDYRQIIAFRNVLIHGYDLVDHTLVWSTIVTRIPTLLRDVEALLA